MPKLENIARYAYMTGAILTILTVLVGIFGNKLFPVSVTRCMFWLGGILMLIGAILLVIKMFREPAKEWRRKKV